MSRLTVKYPVTIRISTGTSVSNSIAMSDLEGMTAFTLFAPTLTDAHTYVLQVSHDGGTTFLNLNDGTADISAPASGKAIAYPNPPCTHLRIKDSTGNVTANADFFMYCEVPVY